MGHKCPKSTQLYFHNEQKQEQEYLRSRAKKYLSLSSSGSLQEVLVYRGTRAYILDLASKNFFQRSGFTKLFNTKCEQHLFFQFHGILLSVVLKSYGQFHDFCAIDNHITQCTLVRNWYI